MTDKEIPIKSDVTKLGKYLSFIEKSRIMKLACRGMSGIQKVVEIGPGRGHVFRWCEDRDYVYEAIDQCDMPVDYELHVARVPPVPPIKGDIYVLMNVLEHMDTPQQADEFISGVFNNLPRGGRIVLQGPDIRFWGKWFWAYDTEHNYPTSLVRMERLLEKHGFEICASDLMCGPVRLPVGLLLHWASSILRTVLLWLSPRRVTTLHKVEKKVMAVVIGRKP